MIRCGQVDDSSRYHTKLYIVDDCGVRARMIEAIVDRVAECVDAPIDAKAATVGEASHRKPEPFLSDAGSVLGLSPYPLEAVTESLQPRSLLSQSRYDLILCTDLAVFERVRRLARAANAIERSGGALPPAIDGDASEATLLPWASHPSGEGTDVQVLCCTDFLSAAARAATADSPVTLPKELLRMVASAQFDQLEASLDLSGGNAAKAAAAVLATNTEVIDLPGLDGVRFGVEAEGEDADAALETISEGIEALCVAAAPCCSAAVAYVAAASREHATRLFVSDVRATFPSADLLPASYEEAVDSLQKQHAVPGGLSDAQRARLYDEHASALLQEPGTSTPGPMRVDVSDLGLSMDDLAGPFGGFSS